MLTKNRVLVSLDWYLVGDIFRFRFVEIAEANKIEPKKTTLMTFELGLPKDIETTLSLQWAKKKWIKIDCQQQNTNESAFKGKKRVYDKIRGRLNWICWCVVPGVSEGNNTHSIWCNEAEWCALSAIITMDGRCRKILCGIIWLLLYNTSLT